MLPGALWLLSGVRCFQLKPRSEVNSVTASQVVQAVESNEQPPRGRADRIKPRGISVLARRRQRQVRRKALGVDRKWLTTTRTSQSDPFRTSGLQHASVNGEKPELHCGSARPKSQSILDRSLAPVETCPKFDAIFTYGSAEALVATILVDARGSEHEIALVRRRHLLGLSGTLPRASRSMSPNGFDGGGSSQRKLAGVCR